VEIRDRYEKEALTMALKEWQKEDESRGKGYWGVKFQKQNFVRLTERNNDYRVWAYKLQSDGKMSKSMFVKDFKTKPQALKFAKNYMRRH
jgi:hypothetical protein